MNKFFYLLYFLCIFNFILTTSPSTRFNGKRLRQQKHRNSKFKKNLNFNNYDNQDNLGDYQDQNELNKPIHAINVTVKVGETVVLNCVINSSYGLNPGVIWMQGKLGNVLTLNTNRITVDPRFDIIQQSQDLDLTKQNDVSFYNLQIENVQLYDENEYACQTSITKRNEDQPNLHSLIYLQVTQSPSFIESLTSESNLAAIEYSEVILKCFASGKPTPRIKWYQIDDSTGAIKDLNHESTSLTIRNLSKQDSSKYECVAGNGILPSVSKKFTLTVYYAPIISTIQPHSNHNSVQSVILGCIVLSNPESTIDWFKLENETITTKTSEYIRLEHSDLKYHIHKIKQPNQTISYLKIKNIVKSDFAKYKCQATNVIGKTEASIELFEILEFYNSRKSNQNKNKMYKSQNQNKQIQTHSNNEETEPDENSIKSFDSEEEKFYQENLFNSFQNESEYSMRPKQRTENKFQINSKKLASSLSTNSRLSYHNHNSNNKTLLKYHINKSNRIVENENSLKRINGVNIIENNESSRLIHSNNQFLFYLVFFSIIEFFIRF